MDIVYKLAVSNAEIKNWVESHGGEPAIINDPEVTEDKIGLRINWKGKKDEAMLSTAREVTRNIPWEEFFAIMEKEQLEFMYAEDADVDETWSYKFVNKYPTEE